MIDAAPAVHDKRCGTAPPGAVYIGRPSPFGNPFSHRAGTRAAYRVATREEAIQKFEDWLNDHPALLARVRAELAGKHLVCWCAPEPCHGDVLLRLANQPAPEPKSALGGDSS